MLPGQVKPKIRVCGDYSVTVNSQLETHRHPIPLPEDLMRKLGGGYCFTKIDLADAYNQIKLGPESQRKLALSITDASSVRNHLGTRLFSRNNRAAYKWSPSCSCLPGWHPGQRLQRYGASEKSTCSSPTPRRKSFALPAVEMLFCPGTGRVPGTRVVGSWNYKGGQSEWRHHDASTSRRYDSQSFLDFVQFYG